MQAADEELVQLPGTRESMLAAAVAAVARCDLSKDVFEDSGVEATTDEIPFTPEVRQPLAQQA